jgi:uncharacterized protein YbbK (DUF523 family)
MPDKIRIGISSCLLGEKVRYDGGHKLDHYLVDTLGQYVQWVPVCPEVEYGLHVPREAMHLLGSPESPRLVTRKTGVDHTDGMKKWAGEKLKKLDGEDLLKSISRLLSIPTRSRQFLAVHEPPLRCCIIILILFPG